MSRVTIYSLDILLPIIEPVCCSMSGSNCCFLTCIQISQEAGQVVWYSHLFKNFPEFFVIHTVKCFSIVSEVEVDVFLKFSCFFDDPVDVGNLISGSSAFSKPRLKIWEFSVHIQLKQLILLTLWYICFQIFPLHVYIFFKKWYHNIQFHSLFYSHYSIS